ncbi:MAG: porin family protein [Bacteroidales bacterium]|nr:porin family protein [Bacteroidales bacterium]
MKHYIKSVLSLALLTCVTLNVSAQKQRTLPMNLVDYDEAAYHFGFTLAVNYMSFSLNPVSGYNLQVYDSLPVNNVFNFGTDAKMKISNIQVKGSPGFSVGIVGNFRLGEYFDLRIVPGLTMAFREIQWEFLKENPSTGEYEPFVLTDTYKKWMKIESVFIDLPVMVRYKAKRIYNVRPYIIGGVEYKFDLLAVKSLQNSEMKQFDFIPIQPNDLYGTLGAGFDFYMFWFKLGVELRMSYGVCDVVNRGNKTTFCTESVESLHSKQFNLTFTFE